MKMNQRLIFPAAVIVAALAGCSGDSTTPAEQAKLKTAFAQQHIDMSQVPANQRQRVQGFIDRANAMRATAEKNGSK